MHGGTPYLVKIWRWLHPRAALAQQQATRHQTATALADTPPKATWHDAIAATGGLAGLWLTVKDRPHLTVSVPPT